MTRCICERPTNSPGLCAECADKAALRRAYAEGRDRQAEWEPLAGWLLDIGGTPEEETCTS